MLNWRITLIGWVAYLLAPLAATAQAANRDDVAAKLDSLVYAADLVIEGRLLEPNKDWLRGSANVRVTAVYRGAATVGQTIPVTGIFDYRKPGQAKSDLPLEPKDHLVMFLNKAGPNATFQPAPLPGEGFTPIVELVSDMSVRLVLRGRVR